MRIAATRRAERTRPNDHDPPRGWPPDLLPIGSARSSGYKQTPRQLPRPTTNRSEPARPRSRAERRGRRTPQTCLHSASRRALNQFHRTRHAANSRASWATQGRRSDGFAWPDSSTTANVRHRRATRTGVRWIYRNGPIVALILDEFGPYRPWNRCPTRRCRRPCQMAYDERNCCTPRARLGRGVLRSKCRWFSMNTKASNSQPQRSTVRRGHRAAVHGRGRRQRCAVGRFPAPSRDR